MFGTYPIGGETPPLGGGNGFSHRPSEDDAKLDIDVNSPLSDEEGDEDEDDFRNIKYLIGKNKKPNNNS